MFNRTNRTHPRRGFLLPIGFEGMVEVAIFQGHWLALEAVVHILALTLQADQFHILCHFATPAYSDRLPHEAELMSILAEDGTKSLLVTRYRMEVLSTIET
jgi:hypothetical protein